MIKCIQTFYIRYFSHNKLFFFFINKLEYVCFYHFSQLYSIRLFNSNFLVFFEVGNFAILNKTTKNDNKKKGKN